MPQRLAVERFVRSAVDSRATPFQGTRELSASSGSRRRDQRSGPLARIELAVDEFRPVRMGSHEGVPVDIAGDAGKRALLGILPEMPAAIAVAFGGEGLHAAQPERVVLEGAFEHVAVEI